MEKTSFHRYLIILALFPASHPAYWRHYWIRLQLRRWLVPALCTLPYLGALLWLIGRSMIWLAQIMLAPILMAAILWTMTWLLASKEFHGSWRLR